MSGGRFAAPIPVSYTPVYTWRCTLNALRIRKRLDAPIPQLPELAPMIGKTVDIIVLEEGAGTHVPTEPTAQGQAAAAPDGRRSKPVQSLDQLRGREPGDAFGEEFEKTITEWRQAPWLDRGT